MGVLHMSKKSKIFGTARLGGYPKPEQKTTGVLVMPISGWTNAASKVGSCARDGIKDRCQQIDSDIRLASL